ncbi:hypothetical protein DMC14_002315 [Metamycoplasma phocicerebrale]|uniref:Asp23/Gls24 family envelope stress response protein n=1 Tax=Metamycoplasma phocicerebrale TaxID=142649 RepID=A0A3Q9VAC0_9BACT|nr:hypothetical protein [Metamycoplasma phocicerebrale]AZZ65608.1 hypothetical protein DMC14_002315 [Metamycoplasma phocicerebrale]
MISKDLIIKIKNWISSIAGVVDFKTLTKENDIDFDNDGLVITKNKKNKNLLDLCIGLIILVNISAKNIVEEIYQIINYNLKDQDLKIGKICVYIKGTK